MQAGARAEATGTIEGTEPPIPIPTAIPDLPGIGDGGPIPDLPGIGDGGPIPDLPGIGGPSPPPSPICQNRGSSCLGVPLSTAKG
jgi:hypothetical protein